MKHMIGIMAVLAALMVMFSGCGKTKVLHCDHCAKEIIVDESSNMDEDWIVYCAECEQELFGDNPVVSPG